MSKMRRFEVAGVLAALLLLGDFDPSAPLFVTLVPEAMAVVGAPATPASVAGVARRTTRREVAAVSAASAGTQQQQAATAQQQQATAQQQQAVAQQQAATAQQQAAAAGAPPIGTVVSALPQGCVSAPKDGVEYQKCGSVYYRSAFQGNTLVYVVAQP